MVMCMHVLGCGVLPCDALPVSTSQGIMLVYDVTNEKSFENIRNWIRNIEEVRASYVTLVCRHYFFPLESILSPLILHYSALISSSSYSVLHLSLLLPQLLRFLLPSATRHVPCGYPIPHTACF